MKTTGKRIAIVTGAIALAVLVPAAWLAWPQIKFRWLFEPLGLNAKGLPEYRHRQTGIVFVHLPGGKFLMGGQRMDRDKPNYDPEVSIDEGPVHEVTLSPFMIAKYEVTQGQWTAVMGSNPSGFKGDEDRPVETVSWDDVQRFNAKTGLRLPTEAEWEYACRGGSTARIAGTGKLDEMGWYGQNSEDTTHPVGKKAANGFGLHDMHGNVWEWCEDVYDEGFYGKLEASGPDPVSKSGSGDRVVRGGAWRFIALPCRSSCRIKFGSQYRFKGIGCRPTWRLP